MSATTHRHHRPDPRRRTGLVTVAVGLGALSAAGITGGGGAAAPVATSSPVTAGVSPVVLSDPAPVLAPVRISCEPDADARFGDPDRPDRITNKACGYRDRSGRARSADPWIDEQLAAITKL